MSMPPLPVPYWPHTITEERILFLRAAAAIVDSPIKFVLVPAEYGSPGRVLCFGELPPFVCKTAPILPEKVDDIQAIATALRIILDPFTPDKMFAEEFWLGSKMGCDVRYSHSLDDTGKMYFE